MNGKSKLSVWNTQDAGGDCAGADTGLPDSWSSDCAGDASLEALGTDSESDRSALGLDEEQLIRLYLADVARIPLLSKDEELMVVQRLERGDETARTLLVEANLRLVVGVAKRYQNRGLSLLDLIQEGNLGLMRATHTYDRMKGAGFGTYAAWWIRHAVTRALADKGRTIRVSSRTGELVGKFIRTRRRLRAELTRDPTLEEIAEKVGISADKGHEIVSILQGVSSLDSIADDGDSTLGESLPDTSSPDVAEAVHASMKRDFLHRQLAQLPQPEKTVISMRFGLVNDEPCTYRTIGAAIGRSGEYVRNLEAKILTTLAAHPEVQLVCNE